MTIELLKSLVHRRYASVSEWFTWGQFAVIVLNTCEQRLQNEVGVDLSYIYCISSTSTSTWSYCLESPRA
jgi:hypothetical protein